MSNTNFDYIIIGSGLAGLQLALAFAEDHYFANYKIALIDFDKKNKNDRTWSFWEKHPSKFEAIVSKTWGKTQFISSEKKLEIPLQDYQYKTIKAVDFYNYCKNRISEQDNIQIIEDFIEEVRESDTLVEVMGKNGLYHAKHVFDSRIPKAFFQKHNYILLIQHFKGWMIESKQPVFDDSNFTMMDYRYKYKNTTSFIYVLPFSANKALIEFTFFSPHTVENSIYENHLKSYISKELQLSEYDILEEEYGEIPMSAFPFQDYHTSKITKIGTAGGWVKASSGYAFKNSQKKVKTLIENIKKGNMTTRNLYMKKYQFYDDIFLDVLYHNNDLGEQLFTKFYSNPIQNGFQFLDEASSLAQDIKIIRSLYHPQFLVSFFRVLKRKFF
ncbi:lycopene cyclase family protein [Mesonia sp. K7]|uniref:lycopene cyclase family protein n=1 Tax=Mesonia sp. K7 TaxID=2218606 RepID=UPI000DA8C9C0|nr:lycopene cyclase family protein [Mesonia sp. K7]PZD77873.1 lycopene cyclase [Mesonia sp. K7]